MSSLIRWEPFRELSGLRDAMDRMFDEGFARPFSSALFDGSDAPTMDLYQTDEEVVVKAALPGVKAEDVQISVTNGVLSIRGEAREDKEGKGHTYHIRERRVGTFQRWVALPTEVNVDKARAEFEGGILQLTLPKAEQVKPKTITVKAKR
jgi:HSP20 family protein